jgi:hypothetical protein
MGGPKGSPRHSWEDNIKMNHWVVGGSAGSG